MRASLKEVAVRVLNVVVRYENPSYEETVLVEVGNEEEAGSACARLMKEMEDRRVAMEALNVYASKRAVSCSLEYDV